MKGRTGLGRLIRAVRPAIVVVVVAGLSLAGVLGGGVEAQHYDTWQTVLSPDPLGRTSNPTDGTADAETSGGPFGAEGSTTAVRSTITFDQDFGSKDRHGPQLTVDHDLGAPIAVTARSPSAPDMVEVTEQRASTRIRVGSPRRTVGGVHRYEVAFTYPRGIQEGNVLAVAAGVATRWPSTPRPAPRSNRG